MMSVTNDAALESFRQAVEEFEAAVANTLTVAAGEGQSDPSVPIVIVGSAGRLYEAVAREALARGRLDAAASALANLVREMGDDD